MSMLHEEIVKILRKYADDIESGNSNLSTNECLELVSQIAHVNLTKQQVAERYDVSPKTIERREKDGVLPPSHPLPVQKKHWYLDELIQFEHDNDVSVQ